MRRCVCGHIQALHGQKSGWCSRCGCMSYQPTDHTDCPHVPGVDPWGLAGAA